MRQAGEPEMEIQAAAKERYDIRRVDRYLALFLCLLLRRFPDG